MQQTLKNTRYKRTSNIEKNYFVAYQMASELHEPAKHLLFSRIQWKTSELENI